MKKDMETGSKDTSSGIRYGYIVLSALVGLMLIVFIILKFFTPGLFDWRLRYIWLNRFFSEPQYFRAYLLISVVCVLVALASLLMGSIRRALGHPVIFAAVFSIPFFITGFEKFYGDSNTWAEWIKYRYFMSEPGSTLIHYLFYRLLHYPLNLGARSIISLTSRLAGFATLTIIAMISNTIFSSSRQRTFFRLVFIFSGPTLLFFGYIENTPLLIPFELIYVFFMIRYLLNNSTHYLVYASLILSVASIIHGSACFVLPSIFIALLAKYGFRWKKLLKYGSMALVVYLLPIALFVGWVFFVDKGGIVGSPYGNVLGGGDKSMFVPLLESQRVGFARYTLFSKPHFLDMFNIMFTGAGIYLVVALAFLGVNLISIRKGINPILFGYFVSRFLFLFLWNCDWGFFNDWDLMIPNALPVLLIAGYAISKNIKSFTTSLVVIPTLIANVLIAVMFFFVLNEKPPSVLTVRTIQPAYHDEGLCTENRLITRYYVEETFTTPVGGKTIDVPYHIWGRRGPNDEIPNQPFGVTWDGYLKVRQKGRHRFSFVIEGDHRFYLNDQLIDERWKKGGKCKREKEVRLYPGLYKFRLEYYIDKGAAMVLFFWESSSFDKRKFALSDFCNFQRDASDSFKAITR